MYKIRPGPILNNIGKFQRKLPLAQNQRFIQNTAILPVNFRCFNGKIDQNSQKSTEPKKIELTQEEKIAISREQRMNH